mgnify:CR=1 FL=1
MTDANDKAWEIALEDLSKKERDRVLRLALLLGVDTADPVWIMLLATALARQEIAGAREQTVTEIEKTVTKVETAAEEFVDELKRQRATIVQDARKELNAERETQEERLREAAREAVNAGVAQKKHATGWKWAAVAGVVALLLTGSAFAIGAVVGQQDAAMTHDRIAERFQGPYSTDEEKLLSITGANLEQADEIIQQCQEKAFTPAQGGRACRITVWVKKSDASDARTSRSWPDRLQSWISDLL